MQVIRVGIIGYGLSGRIFHGAILSHVEGFEVLSVVTTDEAKKQQALKDFPGCEVVESVDDVFDNPNIDLVVVATMNQYHKTLAEQAMEAGKHVVVEKPFTLDVEEALSLIETRNNTGKVLSVYQNRRFDSDFLTLQEIIRDDSLGQVVEFESHFDRFRNEVRTHSWREGSEAPGSGLLYDLGPHLIDQALWLFGMPKEVYADMSRQRGGPAIDQFELIMYYEHLKVTLKVGMLVKEPLPRFNVQGTKGSFMSYGLDVQEPNLLAGERHVSPSIGIGPKENWPILNIESGRKILEPVPGDYRLYYQNIYHAICSNKPLFVTAEDGLDVMRIIEAAKLSQIERRRIRMTL